MLPRKLSKNGYGSGIHSDRDSGRGKASGGSVMEVVEGGSKSGNNNRQVNDDKGDRANKVNMVGAVAWGLQIPTG